jgi:hypothetical protein
LLSRIYQVVDGTIRQYEDRLAAGEQLKSAEINSISGLAKTLPLLQVAEQNHKTSLSAKPLEDLSVHELRTAAALALQSDVDAHPLPPQRSVEQQSSPKLSASPEDILTLPPRWEHLSDEQEGSDE